MIDEYYTFKIFGYHSDDLSYGSGKPIISICDKCYAYRKTTLNAYRDLCNTCAKLTDKTPYSIGQSYKIRDITHNKECASYLGCIAETILYNVYNNIQVMPYGNHGYDFICSKLFKIDVKSSATGDKGYWTFSISKNAVADYFLCIAFNNRNDLKNPVHLWLIPGHKVNHLSGITIYKTTSHKWSKYELSLDKVISCCDSLR